MSVELKTAANIRYINIKMKKKLKNNSEIIYIIKDADELCVKILLFLLCCENSEKIDFEVLKGSVVKEKPDDFDDAEIIRALNFWKDNNILNYEITSVSNINKGANMGNIINLLLNISHDMNVLNGDDNGDSEEFERGLGIYKENYTAVKKEIFVSEEPEEVTEEPVKIIDEEPYEVIEEIEVETDFEVEIEIDADGDDTEVFEEKFDEPEEIDEIEEPEEIYTEPEEETPAAKINPPHAVSSQTVSIDQLSESLETKEDFRRLIHETQIKMQTTFNTAELCILYNLYEVNHMEIDLILQLVEICVEKEKNNIRYLEKVALGMASDGIFTLGQYEEQIQEIYKIKDFEEKIRNLFEVGERKFTSKERNHIKNWVKELDFTDDVLTEGYRRSIKKTEKLSLDYINAIYTGWRQKGFKTLDDINSEYGANSDGASSSVGKKGGGFLEQFLEKTVKNRVGKL